MTTISNLKRDNCAMFPPGELSTNWCRICQFWTCNAVSQMNLDFFFYRGLRNRNVGSRPRVAFSDTTQQVSHETALPGGGHPPVTLDQRLKVGQRLRYAKVKPLRKKCCECCCALICLLFDCLPAFIKMS